MKRLTGHILLCGMLAALCAVSCIKENRDGCLSTVALTFRYNHNPEYMDLFESNADRVRLYFYDSTGKYLFRREADVSLMKNKNTLELQLDQGIYTVVVWVNYNDDEFECLYEQEETFESITLNIKTDVDGNVSGNNINLFHGITTIEVPRFAAVKDTVSVIRDTNDITVKVEGMEGMFRTSYSMNITGHDGTYHFDNSPVTESPAVTYLPEYPEETVDGVHHSVSSFKVMRLWTGCDVALNVMKSGNTVVSENLVEVLQREFAQIQTNEDLDRYYDFRFTYRFDPGSDTFALVRIQVGDWEAVPGQSGEI